MSVQQQERKGLFFFLSAGPVCAWWNCRDADRTKVEGGSRNVIFFVEGLNLADGRSQRAINNLSDIIEKISESSVQLQKLVTLGGSH